MIEDYEIVLPEIAKIDQLVSLCAAHAAYEKSTYSAEGKAERLIADIFCDHPLLHCRVVLVDGKYVGYITWMNQYATWDAKRYLYMDCLYIDEDYRSRGIGEQLINEMKEAGRTNGITLVQWQTPAFNVRAINFYKRIGAYALSKERFFLEL